MKLGLSGKIVPSKLFGASLSRTKAMLGDADFNGG